MMKPSPAATEPQVRPQGLDRSRIELSLRRFWPNLCEGHKRLREATRPSETLYSAGSTELLFGLAADQHGLASVEYVILLVAVTLGATWSVFALGFSLVDSFGWQTGVLGLPVP